MEAYRHTVQYYETDRMGVTHHSNYVRWMEEARIDFFEQIGWSYGKFEEAGIVSPVTALSCHYRHSTTFGDAVQIRVFVTQFNGVRLKLRYEMAKEDGTAVCQAESEHCFLRGDGGIVRIERAYPAFGALLRQLAEQE